MMPTLKSNLYIHFIPITNFQNFTSSLFSNTICINSKNARNFSNNLLNKKIFIYIKNPRNLSISLLNKIRFIKNMNASYFVNRSQSTPTVGYKHQTFLLFSKILYHTFSSYYYFHAIITSTIRFVLEISLHAMPQ